MGIGKQYGIELAKMGFNIVMIDKDAKEMEKTKHEISALGAKVLYTSDLIPRLYAIQKYTFPMFNIA